MLKTNLIAAVLAALLVFGLAGCGGEDPAPQNTIGPMELTDDQRQIVDLLSAKNESSYLFSFQTGEAYTNVSFWVETYREGQPLETQPIQVDLRYEEGRALRGSFSVTVTEDAEWSLVYMEHGGAKIMGGGLTERPRELKSSARAALEQLQEIVGGQAMVLYACVFSDGTAFRTFAAQDLLEPDALAEYEYAQLLKCKFEQD